MESLCSDGNDDDGDGAFDCGDTDCWGNSECECAPTFTATCGVYGNDTTVGAINSISSGWCNSLTPNHTGPEKLYTWAPPTPLPAMVTVHLTNLSADMDLFVLEMDAGEVCAPQHCIGSAMTGGDESVVFNPVAGRNYIFVVDGWTGAQGSYHLNVDCP